MSDPRQRLVMVGALAVAGALFFGMQQPPAPAKVAPAVVPAPAPVARDTGRAAPKVQPQSHSTSRSAVKKAKKKAKAKPKQQRTASVPSCDRIRREYDAMTRTQKISAYLKATPAQVSAGKKCLNL